MTTRHCVAIFGTAAVLLSLGAAPFALNWWGLGLRDHAGLDLTQVALGQQIYAAQCAGCHGTNLEGQPNWRSRRVDGRLPAPPHDITGHTWHHPDSVLFRIAKYGPAAIVGDGYVSDMPGFENVLSDAQIEAVLYFIKSTWPARQRGPQERQGHPERGAANTH